MVNNDIKFIIFIKFLDFRVENKLRNIYQNNWHIFYCFISTQSQRFIKYIIVNNFT